MLPATRPVALAASSAALALLAGCGTDASTENGRSAVASFYPLAWVTEQVAGDAWDVTSLTAPGQEAHHVSLDIRQTAMLEDADLVVTHDGFQSAIDTALANADVEHVVTVDDVVSLRPVEDLEAGHPEEEHDHGGHDHDDHGDDDEGHEDGHEGHDHGDLDPHFWLDPLLMAQLGDAVADELADVDPGNADAYAANAQTLRSTLEELDEDYSAGLTSCEHDVAVVSHNAFGYLARYGIQFEAIAGLTPDAEATAADQARLHEVIKEQGISTVFHERLATSKLAAPLASDLGLETDVLDPIEGLTDETADEDYLSLMRANLAALQEANGCS